MKNDNDLIFKLTGRRCNIYSRDFFSLILGFTGGLLELTNAAATFNLCQKPRMNYGGIQP